MSITAALRRHAAERLHQTAIVFEDDSISWAALDTTVDRLAGLLLARAKGAGVALDLPNSPLLAVLILAAARAGCEAQVMDPAWPPALAAALLESLKPGILVTTRPLDWPGPTLRAPAATFATAADALGAPAARAIPEPEPLTPFYVGFTSGSTGRPKGFRRHHLSWLESFAAEAAEFGTGAQDRVYVPGSMTHSLSVYAMCSALHHGAACILAPAFRPDRACAAMRRHGATLMHSVPTVIALIAEEAAGNPIGSMRMITSSGARLPPAVRDIVARGFPAADLAEFYGASELSLVTVARDVDAVPEGSVGRPFPGVEITIRDRAGRRLPAGRRGTVFVRSPFAFIDYATGEERPLRLGDAISVGDRGFLDARGHLHLVGRADRMVIVSGRNLHPDGLETLLVRHPSVRAAALFGVPDRRRGERLVGVIAAGPDLTRAALVRHFRENGAAHPLPGEIRVVTDWPETASGKTDFAALRALWHCGAGRVLA